MVSLRLGNFQMSCEQGLEASRMQKDIMKNWRGQLLLTAVLSALWWTGGCSKSGEQSGPAADTIKVGEFASLTGSEAAFGQSSHKGTLLAIDQVNSSGGVLGKKIDLICEDDECKPGESATIVKKLISRDKVVAFARITKSPKSRPLRPIPKSRKPAIIFSAPVSPIPSREKSFPNLR
jgi:branched-chain amino acid transport system substrate-binding protein